MRLTHSGRGTNFSEILIEIYTFSLKKVHLKLSGKRRPICLGLNVLSLNVLTMMICGMVCQITENATCFKELHTTRMAYVYWHVSNLPLSCWHPMYDGDMGVACDDWCWWFANSNNSSLFHMHTSSRFSFEMLSADNVIFLLYRDPCFSQYVGFKNQFITAQIKHDILCYEIIGFPRVRMICLMTLNGMESRLSAESSIP